jgi:ketosteroid isomerase-like protein
MSERNNAESQVRTVLETWAKATRENRTGDVLKNHVPDLVVFDVLPPMKYDSADAYRQSWGDWQPEVQGEGQFDLENLMVTAGNDVAFAHCFIRCGGNTPEGRSLQDVVRATFCLCKVDGAWKVSHQHVSKPFQRSGN